MQVVLYNGHKMVAAVTVLLKIIRKHYEVRLVGVNVPFQHKYGYIRDERSGMESYPYPVKEG